MTTHGAGRIEARDDDGGSPRWAYRWIEARAALGGRPALSLCAALALLVADATLLPRLPASVVALLGRVLGTRGMGELVLANNHLAVYLCLFFGAASNMLRVYLAPYEEKQLDLLLAKPVTRRAFLLARAVPVLAVAGASGLLLALASAATAAPWLAQAGGRTSLAAAFLGGVVLTALVVAQLSLLCAVLLRMREQYHGLLAGFLLWFPPLAPLSAYVYRPDVFEGRPLATAALGFPLNLVWLSPQMATVAPAVVACCAAATVAGLALAVRGFERLGARDAQRG